MGSRRKPSSVAIWEMTLPSVEQRAVELAGDEEVAGAREGDRADFVAGRDLRPAFGAAGRSLGEGGYW